MAKKIFILILSIFIIGQTRAQSVGLVLSGGGAKGLAHIAVIRELEENNIPIDYIAGTSIGAIVGGLYAAGFSPDEMEELFRSDDFYLWATGKIQSEYRYFFKQPEPDPSWIQLRLAKKNGKLKLQLPTNLVPPQQMDIGFLQITATSSAACDYDFNKLMVPYFCVASDVNNNQPVVLRNGDLGSAIRASMTFPLYFKPIKINGALLFDGGIYNNFPQKYMKDIFHPDIIIGHKVAGPNKPADSDDILGQLTNMIMRPTSYDIAPKDGILLETKFDDIGLLDFNKIDSILSKGKITANAAMDSIKKLVTRRVAKEEVNQKRNNFNSRKPPLLFNAIQTEGVNDSILCRYITQCIRHKSDIFSLKDLKNGYFKLAADEQFNSIQPLSRYNKKSGYFDLLLKVEPQKKFDVSFGGNISTKPINQGFVGFNYRSYKQRAYQLNANLYFGRFYSSFKIGGRIDFPTRIPFYTSAYFTLNRWDFYTSSSELFFEDVSPPFVIQDELNFRTEGGMSLGRHTVLRTGLAYSWADDNFYQTDNYQKNDTKDENKFKAFAGHVGLFYNSLNYKQYATEGAERFLSLKYVIGEEKFTPGTTSLQESDQSDHYYYVLHGKVSKYFKMSKHLTLAPLAEGILSNKNLFHTYRSTMLSAPAFQPTPHSKSLFIENFHSNNYLAGGLKAIWAFNPDLHLRVEGYAFIPMKEETKADNQTAYKNDKVFDNYYLQGMTSLVYQTGIGPISLSLNYYDKSDTKCFIIFNFGYILFNKRGL